ncbi:MAG: DUF469 family protein [Aureispira sp.]|nr:DUF469 family protein [Aureispira sp.]
MLDLTEELHFEFRYKYQLSEERSDAILDAFIEEIEAKDLYYGGGSSFSYLKGCLDLTITSLSRAEVIDLLNAFATRYDCIDSVKCWDNL